MSNLPRLFGLLLFAGLGLGLHAAEVPELVVDCLSTNGVVKSDDGIHVTGEDPAGIRVTYDDAILVARKLELDRASGQVTAAGAVRLQRGKELWIGERLSYNYLTRQMEAEQFRTGLGPLFAAARGLHSSLTNDTHSATNAVITSDDIADPGYRIEARSIRFVPGQYIEATAATLYLGSVPVMYYPHYRRHLYGHPNNFVFLPGYRSLYGAFLLGTYNWTIATNLAAAIHLDYRTKRGFGGGPDVNYDAGRFGEGELKTYATDDQQPGTDANGNPIKKQRERINFAHSAFIDTNLAVKVVLRQQSDPYVVRDFFEGEYRRDTQPKSFLEASRFWPNFSLDVMAMPQINDFQETVERLPDLKLTALRQQIGATPLFYDGESSLGFFRRQYAEPLLPGETNYSAMRADTYHQILLPTTLFGWLNLTPRAGGRFTYYGDEQGLDALTSSQSRWVFNTGAEISTKLSRVWTEPHSRLFDVTELRHIMEPSINYVFIPNPSQDPTRLPQFDYDLYTFRPPPIDFPDNDSIDAINSQNTIRYGLNNKLQTKRAGQVDNLLNWDLVMDWHLTPRPDQGTFSDVYSQLDFKPRSWLTLNSELRYDINGKDWNMANHSITIQPNDIWNWKVGQRYLRAIPGYGTDSAENLWYSRVYVRLNENWALRMSQHFDARSGLMQEQAYSVYRDMRSWTAALTFRLRDGEGSPRDFTVGFSFSFKAYPRGGVGRDRDEPSFLLGS
ncbi:MAG: LPS assembly protein LptD [Verrucomicrobiota bacterium]|jgi:lipopolysaccharide assembly outer membrane protein LptD (OstA)